MLQWGPIPELKRVLKALAYLHQEQNLTSNHLKQKVQASKEGPKSKISDRWRSENSIVTDKYTNAEMDRELNEAHIPGPGSDSIEGQWPEPAFVRDNSELKLHIVQCTGGQRKVLCEAQGPCPKEVAIPELAFIND